MQGKHILLSYRRRAELTADGIHLHDGSLVVADDHGTSGDGSFNGLAFHSMMTKLSALLSEQYFKSTPDLPVYLCRLEVAKAHYLRMPESLVELLRVDPVEAIRSMSIHTESYASPTPEKPKQVLRSTFDTLSAAFGETLYLAFHLELGTVEDPITGTYRGLARVEIPGEEGWRIRGELDSYQSWLPITIDNSNGMDLTQCKWARVKVEDLLKQPVDKFHLPRLWVGDSGWISRDELVARLELYRSEQKEAE